MGFLSQAFRDQIMSPIGRPVSAMGVRPILREPGLDIPGERSIFQQPSPFGPPIPPTPRPPVVGGPALPPVDPRIIPQRPPSIGGIGGINQPIQPVLQKMPLPPKRDDFMSIERLDDPIMQSLPVGPSIPFVPPPPIQPILQQPPSPLAFEVAQRQNQIGVVGDGMTEPSLIGQEINAPVPLTEEEKAAFGPPPPPGAIDTRGITDELSNITNPVIQPTVTDSTMSTEPVTTPTDPNMSVDMPVAPIDPVLLQQKASEVITDPLLRSLYFGTADSPGFYNQLQQAGANLIGSDVPLQQTAGLAPLELLARQQAVAGLGGFEPFLQQNRDLVNQAIQQSRRAEQLQDPYYTQAEDIYKDTMGAYDPSMTQQFYNPFEDAVVQQTIEDVMKAGEQQDIASRAREISAGAFGGSRARLGAEERRRDLGEGLAKALGGIRSQGFQSAQATGLGEFARQQQAKRTGAQGLMGIGVGRGSAASNLGQQLAGFGGQLTGLGRTQEELRRGQRGELSGYGTTGRGIAETGLGRIFEQQMGQQVRPLGVLGQIGSMLPGYQGSRTQIDSQYGMPTDPSAAGLGAAFSAYGAVAPRQGSG